MSTSEISYLVTMDTTKQLASNEPCDVATVRTLLSNVNFLSDEFAQVLVNWSDADGLVGPKFGGWVPQFAYEFPILQRQSGDAYPFRVRLGGYATGGAVVRFRAIISAPGASGPGLHSQAYGDQDFITVAAGSSPAWLTGSTQGAAASPDLLTLPAALVSQVQVNTLDAIGGNPAVTVRAGARLTVYGLSDKAGTDPPVLSGVYLAQYIGT